MQIKLTLTCLTRGLFCAQKFFTYLALFPKSALEVSAKNLAPPVLRSRPVIARLAELSSFPHAKVIGLKRTMDISVVRKILSDVKETKCDLPTEYGIVYSLRIKSEFSLIPEVSP